MAATVVAVALSWRVGEGAAPIAADKATTAANITRVVTSLLAGSQFAHHPLDDQLAGKLLERYLEALDGSRSLFLQTDVDELATYRRTLAYATRMEGDTRPAQTIFKRFLERLGQQAAYDTELLRSAAFDFTGRDTFLFDRDRAARPRDLTSAHAIWREELRAEVLQEKLGDKKPPAADIAKTLTRRHAQQLRMMTALGQDEVLEIYLDSLTHVYDPHSDYLGHEEMESLSIAMNLSLFGIGASLSSDEGACTVHELVPGSPAEKSGLLKPGDRITAVAQDAGEPVDVTDMPLTRIVGLIRGPKGSVVTLTVLPPVGSAGPPRTVRLVRAEIKLEDQQAKAQIIEKPEPDGSTVRLGVIDLASFYSGDGGASGATADVAKLLAKLKSERVRGVVLDLRRNGGGSLEEAIKLTGLFIKSGPVVQTRDSNNVVQVDTDPDPGVIYDGPLVVLTSRFSASASEIAAGALQDYGRAVIVGDSTTFGKGTVQSILPLATVMDRVKASHTYDPGALKITISKFYRPSGASTELRGVASDIVLPSRSDVAKVGEGELKDPLPWDTVAAARYERVNRVEPWLATLRTQSSRRVEADRGFSDLRAEIATLKARIAAGQVSLNEAQRRREIAATEAREKEIERVARVTAATGTRYAITVKNAAKPGLPPPEVAVAKPVAPDGGVAPPHDHESGELGAAENLVLSESLMILRDYARLLEPKPLGHASSSPR
ncbi:MAG TPA: carboxy terminal-processing peptidase [Polyangia bacterium]